MMARERIKIAPSVLAADFRSLAAEAAACEDAGAESLHFDVMDGQFVPNISYGSIPLRALRGEFSGRFEAHLMVVQPERWIEEFAAAGADLITVQAEAAGHLQRTLAQIRAAGAMAGLALNPATPLNILEYVLGDIDLLLVMTVNPGFGGQEYLPAMTAKIAAARALLDSRGGGIELQVDGGIGPDTAAEVVSAGARVLVAGTSVFGAPGGAAQGVRALREAAAAGQRDF